MDCFFTGDTFYIFVGHKFFLFNIVFAFLCDMLCRPRKPKPSDTNVEDHVTRSSNLTASTSQTDDALTSSVAHPDDATLSDTDEEDEGGNAEETVSVFYLKFCCSRADLLNRIQLRR